MTGASPHVLVVDDDARLRDLLRQFLGRNGFTVTTAADAAEARARLSVLAFDLAVVDVMMPGESGLDLARDGVPVRLTTAEAALLRVLAARADSAVSREDLVARAHVDGGERTIDVQVTRLRRKLEDDPRNPRWLQTVRGAGYILRTD